MAPSRRIPPLSILRAHQIGRRRSGIGCARGLKAKTPSSPPSRLAKITATNTAMNNNRSVTPGMARKL